MLFSQNTLKCLFLKNEWTELSKNLHGGRYSDSPKTNREFFWKFSFFRILWANVILRGTFLEGKARKKYPSEWHLPIKSEKMKIFKKTLLVFLESEYLPPYKISANSDHSFLNSILFSVFWENGLWSWKKQYFAIFRRFRPRKYPKIWVSQNILQNPIKTHRNTLYWKFWVSLGHFLAF